MNDLEIYAFDDGGNKVKPTINANTGKATFFICVSNATNHRIVIELDLSLDKIIESIDKVIVAQEGKELLEKQKQEARDVVKEIIN